MTSEQLDALLTTRLHTTVTQVEGDGQHFYIVVVSPLFQGLSLLERHRLVKETLKDKLDSGELHAVSLRKTLTPEEWAR